MSIYTTQLRYPVERRQRETHSDPDDYSKCYAMLGLDSYPIFKEEYRKVLNDKIIRHYYFREIGFETVAQFAFHVRNTMNELMPYFNQLYNSLDLIKDPITNRWYTWTDIYKMAQGGTTKTDTSADTDSHKVTENEHTDTTRHGKKVRETDTYGKTDTLTDSYGKTETEGVGYGKTETEVDEYGKTTHDETTTEYGRTQHTENGGSDLNTEGATHERVIREDTPMNLIPSGAIENLNYATDVTYTDREGTGAAVTEYGGTTDIENGGSDTVTGDGSTGGQDTHTRRSGGSDTRNTAQGGKDTHSKVSGGADRHDTENSGSDTVDGGYTTDERQTSHSDGSTGFSRDLDENGERTHNVSGYDGVSPSDLLAKYRETFLNVDLQVINSLSTCFFGLWN